MWLWRCRHEWPRALRRLGAARRGQGDARQGGTGAGVALRERPRPRRRPHPSVFAPQVQLSEEELKGLIEEAQDRLG